MPKKKKGKTFFVCASCGAEKEGEVKLSQKQEKAQDIEVVHGEQTSNPITKEDCPKCGNTEAEYWIQQTRAADEAPTRFLKCTKCKYTWREYD